MFCQKNGFTSQKPFFTIPISSQTYIIDLNIFSFKLPLSCVSHLPLIHSLWCNGLPRSVCLLWFLVVKISSLKWKILLDWYDLSPYNQVQIWQLHINAYTRVLVKMNKIFRRHATSRSISMLYKLLSRKWAIPAIPIFTIRIILGQTDDIQKRFDILTI